MKQTIIGTAGHIDHGKTSIVKQLTGKNTDILKIEKERGMTIDLGFAFMSNKITIIDVPGHEKFIRNMVAGVNSIDIGLLVISADDGIMPQTKEHFDILSLLEIPQGIVVLNKVDLINDKDWLNLIEEDIRGLLKDTFMENSPIVRVSAKKKYGIDKLKKIIFEISKNKIEKKDRGFFRLSVDRSFSQKGFGTIATGSVLSGKIRVGEDVEILPKGVHAKIRGIQTHESEIEKIKIGERGAINLSNIEKNNISRGSQIIETGHVRNSQIFLANIYLNKNTNRIIKHNQRIRIHINTEEVLGRVLLFDKLKKISSGSNAKVLIKIENAIPIVIDDLFIIRFYSPQETIGGGKIFILIPINEKELYLKNIKFFYNSNSIDRLEKLFILYKNNPKKISKWRQIWNMSLKEIKKTFDKLDLVYFGSKEDCCVALNNQVNIQINEYITYLNKALKNINNRMYLSKAEIFTNLNFSESLFNYITSQLILQNKIKIKDGNITLFDHKIKLSKNEKDNLNKLNLIINSYGFSPPGIKELSSKINVNSKKIVELLFILMNKGKVVRISDEVWINNQKIDELKNKISIKYKENIEFSVSDIKEIAGISRKYAIPILEFFDKEDFTYRVQNLRKLK